MLKGRHQFHDFQRTEKSKYYEHWMSDGVHLYFLRKKASHRTIFHFGTDGTMLWEQLYPFGGISTPVREKKFYFKPSVEKDMMTVVLYRGEPLFNKGLDEGIFVSSKDRYKDGCILFLNDNAKTPWSA